MEMIVELTSFYPIVKEHGLSKWWLYKKLRRLSWGLKRGVQADGRSTSCSLVPYEEMMELILRASKKRSIDTIMYRIWTIVFGRRMTHIASKSHGSWQKHYSIQRSKGRITISTPEHLFALRPRAAFFFDNLDDLDSVVSPDNFLLLKNFLLKIRCSAKKYLDRQCKNQVVLTKISDVDYEQFYQLFLDGLLYGENVDIAFRRALSKAPKRSDKGSSKEFLTYEEGGIERYGESLPETAPLKMDYEKLRKKFAERLLLERLEALRARKGGRFSSADEKKACSLAAEDMVILDYVIEGLTDSEIHARLQLKCTRQSLSMRRAKIMDLAKEHFSPLRD